MNGRPVVLVVDDVPENIAVLAAALGADYEVRFATTGAEALRIAETSPDLDLVLLDVVMPGMNGYEVCRRLKASEHTAGVPVIFLTARDEASDEQEGFAAGAVDYIVKPFRGPLVNARVRTHVELKRKTDQLASLALLDGLTGIANRRRFDEVLRAELRRMARAGTPLALVMLDVDYFKAFNDRYGHLAGDDCLRTVASCLAETLRRSGDLAARLGGEEFALLLPSCDRAAGAAVADRVRAAVAARAVPHAGSPLSSRLTVSMGVAALVPAIGTSPGDLLDAADRALYQAKAEGRDRVVLAPAPA